MIDQRYSRYLAHFGATVTVRELDRDRRRRGVALRHDVDHDLALALDMAFWEHRAGIRATYYLLPTAPYWGPDVGAAARQFEDYGHEVGLHLNALAQWWGGEVDDPVIPVTSALEELRSAGASVVGTSAHGDRRCYEGAFINYWLFSEVRPEWSESAEDGLSAEGVPDPSGSFRIRYPSDSRLRRPDGRTFHLWSIRRADLGLEHEAVKVPTDRYFTDSGGSWSRSPDPLDHDLRSGRHQILIHPEYWRGTQRFTFILSTARAGSTWLARNLDRGTSCVARHELTLNHRYRDDQLVAEKRTGTGARDFLADKPMVWRLLAETRAWIEDEGSDYIEANVYLPHVLSALQAVFPEAELLHLHREPRDVVRSLLNRGWYDTPHDDRHPRMDVRGWDQMGQLERCCWYVRRTNELLMDSVANRLPLAEISPDPARLQSLLANVQIAFHPQLVDSFESVVNANEDQPIGPFATWARADQATADRILGPVRRRLGYARSGPREFVLELSGALRKHYRTAHRRAQPTRPKELLATHGPQAIEARLRTTGCHTSREGAALTIRPEGERHGTARFGGGSWQRLLPDEGWPVQFGSHVEGTLVAEVDGPGTARIIALQYDTDGRLLTRRELGRLESGHTDLAFRPRPDAARFDIALYLPLGDQPRAIHVQHFDLRRVWGAA